jgi:histidinol-phosphate/aromatic aminotransferase/cobyric acid decarboxylase-like protein
VLIRDLSGAVPGHLRVSVGTEAENDRFLAALDAALAGA